MTADAIEARGRAMRAFCERVRARGSRAVTEEDEDLVMLRAAWIVARAAEQRRGRRR
jgi:hypothetical protein